MKYLSLLFSLNMIIILSGCAKNPPLWECQERDEFYRRNENAFTQLEMNENSYKYVDIARRKMLTALRYKLSTLSSQDDVLWLLKDQASWQSWFDKSNEEPMTDGSIAPLHENHRSEERYFQRFTALTATDDIYKISRSLNGKTIRFNQQNSTIEFGEIPYRTPDESCYYCKGIDKRATLGTRTFFPVCAFPHHEYLARVNINFCRSVDNYTIAIIEPTNYGGVPSYDEKQQVNLCIWLDNDNTANYLLGNGITVKKVAIDGDVVRVIFSDEKGFVHSRSYDYRQSNEQSAFIKME